MKTDQFYMNKAVEQASKANSIDEVPIGAVLVDQQGVIIAQGYNQVEKKQTQVAHAEMLVLQKAAKKMQTWRLLNTTLYVTVQPCMMCLGALYLSRVARVVYGAQSLKFGISIDKAITSGIYKNLSMSLEYMEYKKAKEVLQIFFQKKRRMEHVQKGRVSKN
ncbi:MAG: tRNA-specific adenosine deaminase [Epsilonproteobacteria bacterium]|nr:tRNA-specific adenosine deaminase [Campylobacterota bacterium]|tara:strand:+ start:2660 stop:3145 length:486 start_codon:yes stop_codon:yes gene_type:complete